MPIHSILWYIFGSPQLSKTAQVFFDNAAQNGQQIAIASITLVEMVYLIEKGRIAAESFSRLTHILETSPASLLEIPLDLRIARTLSRVDMLQIPDLPDRVIAATALHLGIPLISRDAKIQVSDINTIW